MINNLKNKTKSELIEISKKYQINPKNKSKNKLKEEIIKK